MFPLAIMSVLSTIYSSYQANQQMKTQQKIVDAEYKNNMMISQAQDHANTQALIESVREEADAQALEERQRRRDLGTGQASLANRGLTGISNKRVLDNINFQSTFNANEIASAGNRSLREIASQGFTQSSNIQQALNANRARRAGMKTENLFSIATKAGLAGASTYYATDTGKKQKKDS